ncbi:MAG: pseudaminic acid synthase [Verrucomicrobiaceae bacterium]|nr:pseudaminic acid synthase [Verrucomicrobiaceae bacterium]
MKDNNSSNIEIAGQSIGGGHPAYVIAEISANHNQDIGEAKELIGIAKNCGADAVKLQTYTPDTLTIDCDNEWFQIGKGTLWEGKNLYQLYGEAYTPWEWHEALFAHAKEVGITLFSSPFDESAVEFLEGLDVPAYKIASFEMVHHPLIRKVAETGKPVIISTGMASLAEISEAVEVFRAAGGRELALLKCTSAYPAPAEEVNLRRIPHMAEAFGVPVGLSDHTMGSTVPAAAVALGACIIEKHFTRSRETPGPDSAFSLEPDEFKAMIDAVRMAEAAVGSVNYSLTDKEVASRVFRRSLFVVEDIEQGAVFTAQNVRIVRPGYGLAPKHIDKVLGKSASRNIARGAPLTWDHLG